MTSFEGLLNIMHITSVSNSDIQEASHKQHHKRHSNQEEKAKLLQHKKRPKQLSNNLFITKNPCLGQISTNHEQRNNACQVSKGATIVAKSAIISKSL